LVRDALISDLRRHQPEWLIELHRRATEYYFGSIWSASADDPRIPQWAFDIAYLHRANPAMRPFFRWNSWKPLTSDTLKPADWEHLRNLLRRYEGNESVRWAEYWATRQPESVLLYRDDEPVFAGLSIMIKLMTANVEDAQRDPATRAFWYYLEKHAPLRVGECAYFTRFWLSRDDYQNVSSVQSYMYIDAIMRYMVTPLLAYTGVLFAEPEFWAEPFAYMDYQRLEETDVQTDDNHFGAYGHDWRVRPYTEWFDLMAKRMVASGEKAQRTTEMPITVDERVFHQGVRLALVRDPQLSKHPILRCKLVLDRVGTETAPDGRIAVLVKLIDHAVQVLSTLPEGKTLGRVADAIREQSLSGASKAAACGLSEERFAELAERVGQVITNILWGIEVDEPKAEPHPQCSNSATVEALCIATDGSWFCVPSREKVDLSRRQALRRILAHMLRARLDEPGRVISSDEVLAAGWPGERVIPRAGASRVYVAIRTLRKFGLRDFIVTSQGGYLLHSAVEVIAE